MAVACSQLLAAPEEHVRNLRALLALVVDDDLQVRPYFLTRTMNASFAPAP